MFVWFTNRTTRHSVVELVAIVSEDNRIEDERRRNYATGGSNYGTVYKLILLGRTTSLQHVPTMPKHMMFTSAIALQEEVLEHSSIVAHVVGAATSEAIEQASTFSSSFRRRLREGSSASWHVVG